MNWEEARAGCISQGGPSATLASVHDAQENYFVLTQLRELSSWSSDSSWIGLNKVPISGEISFCDIKVGKDVITNQTL